MCDNLQRTFSLLVFFQKNVVSSRLVWVAQVLMTSQQLNLYLCLKAMIFTYFSRVWQIIIFNQVSLNYIILAKKRAALGREPGYCRTSRDLPY